MTTEITLEEACQDYLDNERDIQMLNLMADGGWKQVAVPTLILSGCMALRGEIVKVITERGGTVPMTETQQLRARVHALELENQELQKQVLAYKYSFD